MGRKLMAVLCILGVLAFVLGGCTEESGTVPPPTEDPPEAVQAPESMEPEGEAELDEEDSLPEADRNSFENTVGKVFALEERPEVMIIDLSSGDYQEGTGEDLAEWIALIHSAYRTIDYLYACDMHNESYDLTPEEIGNIIALLNGMELELLEEMGNPATGGSMVIAALDKNEEVLWRVSMDGYWFVADFDGKTMVFDMENVNQDNYYALREAVGDRSA